MKKIALLLSVSIFLFALWGCQGSVTPTMTDTSVTDTSVSPTNTTDITEPASDTSTPGPLSVSDYFPMLSDVRYIYEGEGNEYAPYDFYVDFSSNNAIQQRVDNGGTVSTKVITITDGKLIITYLTGEAYYRENFLDETNINEILLMEPIAVNTTWTLSDGSIRTITNLAASVSTPYGEFEAVEVTTNSEYGTTTDYYAKGVGLIKSIFRVEDFEVFSTLSAIEENTPLKLNFRFFYPNLDANTIYYVDRELEFHTNDLTGDIIAASYKDIPSGVEKVFSENTAINSLKLGDDGIVHLDLNAAFLTEMNAGSAYEGMILDSIANTFAGFYYTDKVILTIDGELYSSGHFAFNEGDYLQAKLDEAVPLS